jgi:hypothetical protein
MRSVFLWNDPQPRRQVKKWSPSGAGNQDFEAARRFFILAINPINGDMTSVFAIL